MATAKKTSSRTASKKSASPSAGSTPSEQASSSDEGATPRKRSARATSEARPSSKRTGSSAKKSGPQIAAEASRQLLELAGKEAEGVTGLQKTDEGWTVQVEVLELSRVPMTTDVLASYEVEMDGDGDLMGYRRVRRYVRGVPGEE